MALTPDGKRLVITEPKHDTVAIMDAANGKRLASLATPKEPIGIGIMHRAYAIVSVSGSSGLSLLDLSSYRVCDTTTVPDSTPGLVTVAPDERSVWVVNQKAQTVLVFEILKRP